MAITAPKFVEKWAKSELGEIQGYQSHFNDLCELVEHETPAEKDPTGEFFTFEANVVKATGGKGRADVWYKGHFAWEYKGKHKDLDAAYAQLSAYRGGLDNPPLLVVCDFLEYRIYPQWPNMSGQPIKFTNEQLLERENRRYISWLLRDPSQFQRLRESELEQREQLTRELAYKFAHLADLMRSHEDETGKAVWEPMQIARFLTKLVFSLFVEDIGLLPKPFGQNMFRYIAENTPTVPEEFVPTLVELFKAMDGQTRGVFMHPVPYFNGGLFVDSTPGAGDGTEALDLTQIPGGVELLGEASDANWSFVDPTIFGTLFEGALDPSKRAQLGAHFTSEEDIRLVVEPVLMKPLYREWDMLREEAEPLMQTFLHRETPRAEQQARERLIALHDQMMDTLANVRVLDPACGSGNFLYVSLRAMKDLEARVRKFFEPLGLPFRDVVTPRQFRGIEKDEFAARLAYVVTWIGYLQWRYEDEEELHPLLRDTSRPHSHQLPHPILQDDPSRIECTDAIMRYDESGKPYEPEWPEADVMMGNPPFLGDKVMRSGRPELGQRGLGDKYVDDLRELYGERIPGQSDLVCYWFEKARAMIAHGKVARVGLLATNSIRHGSNRTVLDRIKHIGDIFMAWSDRPWVQDGAAVRVSMIGFDNGSERLRQLDGVPVVQINPDLTSAVDVTKALTLSENQDICFLGMMKAGPFDIDASVARLMLQSTNPSGKSNADVVKRRLGGQDVTTRWRDTWIIDFGVDMPEEDAAQYQLPYQHVLQHVKPIRDQSRRQRMRVKRVCVNMNITKRDGEASTWSWQDK